MASPQRNKRIPPDEKYFALIFPKWHNPSISAVIAITDRCLISVRQRAGTR